MVIDLIIKLVESIIRSMTILNYVYTSLQNIGIKNGRNYKDHRTTTSTLTVENFNVHLNKLSIN